MVGLVGILYAMNIDKKGLIKQMYIRFFCLPFRARTILNINIGMKLQFVNRCGIVYFSVSVFFYQFQFQIVRFQTIIILWRRRIGNGTKEPKIRLYFA